MAFATKDPKKLEWERERQKALEAAAAREIADIEAREAREREIKEEMRSCYREYCPTQIKNAGKMIQNGNDAAWRIEQAENAGIACWERIGRSNGGKRKRNLYRCMVQA